MNPAVTTKHFHFSSVTQSGGGQDPSPKGERQIGVEMHIDQYGYPAISSAYLLLKKYF